jgi:hypothetical protein
LASHIRKRYSSPAGESADNPLLSRDKSDTLGWAAPQSVVLVVDSEPQRAAGPTQWARNQGGNDDRYARQGA